MKGSDDETVFVVKLSEGTIMKVFAVIVKEFRHGGDLQVLSYGVEFFEVERCQLFRDKERHYMVIIDA